MSIEIKMLDCPETVELTVGMGEIMVAESPYALRCIGVGSCVAVALYDKAAAIGGLAHIMLPQIAKSSDKSSPARYGDMAVAMMVNEMQERDVSICNLKAKIFGGANMFSNIISPDSTMNIGQRNISAVREELIKHDIEIVVEDVGGHVGRSVLFDMRDGSVVVKTTNVGEKNY
ncbi:MAG: chemotaxis protein CheD [Planctomycetota bacterium]|nr:MAG: chemotaxis protein CheD [Planctomycetota bacterium]